MLSNSAVVSPSAVAAQHSSKGGKGAEIRAKIAANRAKRLAIAEAMKREAGVTTHEINKKDLSGYAYFGTGRIISPEGRKIEQLYTLAHECGHIILHSSNPGYWLPPHVQELEAESYAHQAFREHGMVPPRRLSEWGRQYVGSWIARDRGAGMPIDPRAEAYASGCRSPYEPLRMVPSTWRIFHADGPRPARVLARLLGNRLMNEARAVVRLAAGWALGGYMAFGVGCMLLSLVGGVKLSDLSPDIFPDDSTYLYRPQKLTALCCGLLLANLAVLCRTLRR